MSRQLKLFGKSLRWEPNAGKAIVRELRIELLSHDPNQLEREKQIRISNATLPSLTEFENLILRPKRLGQAKVVFPLGREGLCEPNTTIIQT